MRRRPHKSGEHLGRKRDWLRMNDTKIRITVGMPPCHLGNTVNLGYCDNGYCDKLDIVTTE